MKNYKPRKSRRSRIPSVSFPHDVRNPPTCVQVALSKSSLPLLDMLFRIFTLLDWYQGGVPYWGDGIRNDPIYNAAYTWRGLHKASMGTKSVVIRFFSLKFTKFHELQIGFLLSETNGCATSDTEVWDSTLVAGSIREYKP